MDALVLGGESQRHYDWVRQVADSLRPLMDKVVFLDYRHWKTGEGINIEHEIARAAKLTEELDEFIVVAKSIGTVVTTLANARGLIDPARCVFLGFPLKAVQQLFPEVARALPELPPTSFVHNEHDPLGNATDVQAFVQANAPREFRFYPIEGNDSHTYIDFEFLVKLATG
ncbi:MAG TPA: hypothetical protein VLG13_01000 [Patescibacteria group bacterium]|nr:hypothetical protein [Patescibacteria group bacterium]